MASPGYEYLPELARFIAGDKLVFSWWETFRTLSQEDFKLNSYALNFLVSSPKVKQILTHSVPFFASPSPEARTQLETKTAAINTTSSTQTSHNVEEIKQNAKWLSEEVKLSEDEALRVAILELQQRFAHVLAAGYSDAELASLRDALGQDPDASQRLNHAFARRDDQAFETNEATHYRILSLYLQEEIGLLGVTRRLQELAILHIDDITIPDSLRQFAQDINHGKSTDAGITSTVEAIELRLQELGAGKSWSIDSADVDDRWIASELQCVLILQEILLLRIRNASETVNTEILLNWLQIMAGCEFFSNIQPGPYFPRSQLELLQAMTSLTILAMMDPTTAMNTLAGSTSLDPTSYFLNGDSAHDIHKLLLAAAEACIPQACPSALAWALILGELKRQGVIAKESRESGAVQRAIDQGVATYDTATGRRTSSGSLQQSVYEDVVSAIMNTSDISDPATYLLRCVMEAAHVFDTIGILAKEREYGSILLYAVSQQVLQELLLVCVTSIGYTTEILSAQFSILSSKSTHGQSLLDPRETFIKNDILMENIFAIAAGRFPYESLPLLRLCRLLAPSKIFDNHGTQYIAFRLKAMESSTQSATGSFAAYHTVREDENLNLVALDGSADIFRGSQKRLLSLGQPTIQLGIIPADTIGEVISESIPPIIRWQHSFSGLALIGTWLELRYLGQLPSVLSPCEPVEDVVTECIAIISSLLRTTMNDLPSTISNEERKRLCGELLSEASAALQVDSGVVDYIFEILEQELQAYRRRPSNTFNTSVLIACVDFVSVFSQVRPEQFWPLFSKSSIFESYGSDSFLLSIISGVEVPDQNFTFLLTCAKLYGNVVKATLQQARPHVYRARLPKTRKTQPQNLRLHANSLMSLTQSLYNAFEAIPSWSFISLNQQREIIVSLANSFREIITLSNSVEHSASGLTSSFKLASDFLLQQTRLSSDDLTSTTSIVRHLFSVEESGRLSKAGFETSKPNGALQAVLILSTTIVRIGKLRSEAPSLWDSQLFSAIPLLCRDLQPSTAKSALSLMKSLLDAVAKSGPVSLLGHLGSVSSMNLLEILKSQLGDWSDNALKISIWELLAKLVGRNQQWLAIVILTGSPPDKSHRDDARQSSKALQGRNFMELALGQLTKIIELDQQVAISMLKFVIKAQMNWSWANEAMKSDKDFLPAIMSYVCNTYVDASDELKIAYRNRVASLVTDLATIHLHHAKARRDATTLQTVVPLLRWLTANAIEVASYKYSLHANLRKNFASKFGGVELNDFKRTGLIESSYGDDYYYDLGFANEVLESDSQWNRNDRGRDQSFSAEIRRANVNLSVIDSEVNLLNSLLNLCLEHSGYFAQDAEVQKIAIDMVKRCLDANAQPYPSEKIFDNVLQIRVDMSISLLQRLVDAKASGPDVRLLLKHAWGCANINNGSFEQAINDDSLTYWRSLLTTILFTLQFHVGKRYMPPAANSTPAALLHHTEQATSTMLEILSVVVGRGFRSVAAALQDQKQPGANVNTNLATSVSHKDVYIILTIFETILKMERLPEFISEASQRLIAEGAIQSCMMLYSWSHFLTGPDFDNEPICAAYSLRFLASLSSLPPVTEELAVEGILSRLLSSRITQKLQAVQDGAAHLDKRQQFQSLYNLWATGLLPVCLNLLHAVGAPVAAEVSIFLNQFSNQLSLASAAFIPSQPRLGSSNAITSVLADEAVTLALISHVLSSFRNAGASAAVDPSAIQPLIGYDEHKKALAEDISDVVNSTTASLKTRIVAVNEKEAALSREGSGEGLAKKVVSQLRNALTCLKGEEVEDDK